MRKKNKLINRKDLEKNNEKESIHLKNKSTKYLKFKENFKNDLHSNEDIFC